MPKATLSARRVARLVGRDLPRHELEELLFASKSQVEGGEGDALEVEGTADRLDLLTESGIALHLQGVLGVATGLPAAPAARHGEVVAEVDASVSPLRPHLAGVVVTPPEGAAVDADLLDEAIRFQELLHGTIGLDRRLSSLGIYPLERIRPPIRYALEPLGQVRFVPLDGVDETSAEAFFAGHRLALAYGSLGRSLAGCLTLRDATGAVLSLPPVLNGRTKGEARPGDGALLLEATGTRQSRVLDALALLTLLFAARGWGATPITVRTPDGAPGPSAIAPRRLHLPSATLTALAGESLASGEVETLLERARFSVRAEARGWRIEAAPWRVDLHGPVDVAEDLLIARGLRAETGLLPPAATRGARSDADRFRARVSSLLLGLGFTPLYTTVLVSERLVVATGRDRALALTNPVSEQFARLRDSLVVALAAALEHNVRHGYPQRLSEVGPVVVPSTAAESGGETRYHAGLVLAEERAGFATGAALVDYLMRTLGAVGVREPASLPGTIPGRAAVVRLAGVTVGEVGELAPALLEELSVPVPAVWAEVDLTALELLLAPVRAAATAVPRS